MIGSPTRAQLPDGGTQPPAFICDWRISLSPWNKSMVQWSANCGTRVSATCLRVVVNSSDPASCSPMRSSSETRSRSRRLLRRLASRARITMPSMEPDGWRSGIAWARTNTREPSARRTANVPSPPRPRSTCLASSAAFPASPPEKARDSTGRPSSLPFFGNPNSAAAKGLA